MQAIQALDHGPFRSLSATLFTTLDGEKVSFVQEQMYDGRSVHCHCMYNIFLQNMNCLKVQPEHKKTDDIHHVSTNNSQCSLIYLSI